MEKEGQQVLFVKTAAEISLKSSYVEIQFLRRLRENIRIALKKNNLSEGVTLLKLRGRIIVCGKNVLQMEKILLKIFGIHSVAIAERFENPVLENISSSAVSFAKRLLKRGDSFAVRAHCGNVAFSSHDLNVKIGSDIMAAISGLSVNLSVPQKQLFVEVARDSFFLFSQEKTGVRGLPLGVEGNVAFFFSGKKSDLLAAWLLLKRGCSIFPIVKNKKVISKLKKLVEWNCWREFFVTGEKDLNVLIATRGIAALATGDTGITKRDFVKYSVFDKKFSLPVLRPALLLPEKDIFLPKF